MIASNRRYLESISTFDNREVGRKRLEYILHQKVKIIGTRKGLFFSIKDLLVLTAIVRGEFNINGYRNKNMQKLLGFNGGKISRLIKRLRLFLNSSTLSFPK